MVSSIGAELVKLIQRPAVWVVCIVWLALLLAFTELFPFVAYRSAINPRQADTLLAPLLPSQLPGHAITGYPIWGGALILVLGALAWGSEYGWGTLRTMLSNRPGRVTYFVSQVSALGIAIAALAIVAFALCTLSSYAIATAAGASIDFPSAPEFVKAMAAGWLILFMWSSLGAALAILFRGTALSIGIGLVWVLAVEGLIRFAAPLISGFASLEKVLPGADAGALVAALGGSAAATTGVASVVGGARALISVLIYASVFAVTAGLVIARRDVE
jgi:hypothetical protein